MAKSRVPVHKRKNILIDQRKLDAAKRALGALTEAAAIDAALDLVIFRAEVFSALDRVAINQLIATSSAEKMSAVMTSDYLAARAKRGSSHAFKRVLKKVKDLPPTAGDER